MLSSSRTLLLSVRFGWFFDSNLNPCGCVPGCVQAGREQEEGRGQERGGGRQGAANRARERAAQRKGRAPRAGPPRAMRLTLAGSRGSPSGSTLRNELKGSRTGAQLERRRRATKPATYQFSGSAVPAPPVRSMHR